MNFCKILAATLMLALASTALAAPRWKAPTAGNYLVSTRIAIIEFTPDGKLVQSILPPRPPEAISIAGISAVACSDRGEIYAVVTHRLDEPPYQKAHLWVASAEDTSGRYIPLPPLTSSYRTAQIELLDKGRIAVRLERDAYLLALDDEGPVELPSAERLQVAGDRFLMCEMDERGVSTIKIYAGENFAVDSKFNIPSWTTLFATAKDEKAVYIVAGREIRKLDWRGKLLKQCSIPPTELSPIPCLEVLHNGDLVVVMSRTGKIVTFDKNLEPDDIRIFATGSDSIQSITDVPPPR